MNTEINDYAFLVDDELISGDIMDPRWDDSPYFLLKCMKAKQAGSRYEKIVEAIYSNAGETVEAPTSTDHDRIINDEKVEIKGSMITKGSDDKFSFLQIRPAQEYDKVVFLAIYFDKIHLYEMTKEQILEAIENGTFKKQHGGKKANSGTYCFNGSMEKLGATPVELV
jgi:hypothetical protein